MTTKETKHTPGAMRAANKICLSINPHPAWEESACIIDKETHAPELLAALKGLFRECAMVHKTWGDSCNRIEADAAIESARAAIAAATKE